MTISSINYVDTSFEIVLVIDALSRVQKSALAELQNVENLRIIWSESGSGISNTLNVGLREAHGDYIVRIDDGDRNLRTSLSDEIRMLKNCDLVCGSMSINSSTVNGKITPKIIKRLNYISPFSVMPHPTWVLKRSSINFYYNQNDHRCEDFGFIFRNKFDVRVIEKTVTQYDVDNKLFYLSEIKAAYSKMMIGIRGNKNGFTILEFVLYFVLRCIRLTITTKKVVRNA